MLNKYIMSSCLVLNADFSPLSIIPISAVGRNDAIRITFLKHAAPISYYENWKVRSPSTELLMPSVIVSNTFIKKKHSVRFSRMNLLIRDDFTCQYCTKKLSPIDLTIDHVIPKIKGGKTRWENIVSACYVCNSIKGHRNHMIPKKMPVKPSYYDLLDNIKKTPITIPSKTWLDYLNWDPNLVTIKEPKENLI